MTAKRSITGILGDSEVPGVSRSRLLRLPMRSPFSMTPQKPELLPPAAGDCAAGRGLTKSEEEETIIINRSGRSTHPEEKSVQTSGATLLGVSYYLAVLNVPAMVVVHLMMFAYLLRRRVSK
jgi:hypothetical protein